LVRCCCRKAIMRAFSISNLKLSNCLPGNSMKQAGGVWAGTSQSRENGTPRPPSLPPPQLLDIPGLRVPAFGWTLNLISSLFFFQTGYIRTEAINLMLSIFVHGFRILFTVLFSTFVNIKTQPRGANKNRDCMLPNVWGQRRSGHRTWPGTGRSGPRGSFH
jgi:hypothetical protein